MPQYDYTKAMAYLKEKRDSVLYEDFFSGDSDKSRASRIEIERRMNDPKFIPWQQKIFDAVFNIDRAGMTGPHPQTKERHDMHLASDVLNDMGRSRGYEGKFLKDFFDRQFPVQDMVIPSEGAAVKEAERKQRQGMFGPNNYMDEDINSRYPYRY